MGRVSLWFDRMNLLAELTGHDFDGCPQTDQDMWPVPWFDNLIEATVRDMLDECTQCRERVELRIDMVAC